MCAAAAPPPAAAAGGGRPSFSFPFTRPLSRGISGSDVAALQRYLISASFLSSGSDTGYYGPLTYAAVKKLQCALGVVCPQGGAAEGYGVFGGATIRALTGRDLPAAPHQPKKYVRLFYYKDGPLARASLFAHPDFIDVLAPQAYSVDETGALSGSIPPAVAGFAKNHAIALMPLLTNDGFGKEAYQAILDDPAKERSLVAALVAEAERNGYLGWQIDFEQMDAAYRDRFSAFAADAAAALRRSGLELSVAVVAKVSDNPADYPNNLWQTLIGAYDYGALASSTDFVSVMSYDDPSSKGPVAGLGWFSKVLAYSEARIPAQKLSIGIPLYYWQWSDETGKRIGIGGREGIQNVLNRHRVSVHWSAAEQTPYLHYWNRARGYTIWYENEGSVARKIALLRRSGLFGFSAWALGLELPTVYGAMRE